MPRRRHGWTIPKVRKPRVPRMPKSAKLPRPKAKDLRAIYKGFITTSIQNRIATLAYALQWYDGALPYVIQNGGFTPEGMKRMETAVKCRKQAIGTNVDHEKETAFLMAIRQYEKAFTSLKPPVVDDALTVFNTKKQILLDKQAKLEQRYGFVVGMLQQAIGARIKLEVADAVKPVQYNPTLTTLSYNRDAAKAMAEQFKAEGILPVFFGQLEILSRYACIKPDGNGGFIHDHEDQIKTMEAMLTDFATYAKSLDSPKKLLRSGVVPAPAAQPTVTQAAAPAPQPAVAAAPSAPPPVTPAPATPKAPAGPRPPRHVGKGPKVAGVYSPGSRGAVLYELLKDGVTRDIQVIYNAVTASGAQDPKDALQTLRRDGIKYGKWNVVIQGQTARMEVQP